MYCMLECFYFNSLAFLGNVLRNKSPIIPGQSCRFISPHVPLGFNFWLRTRLAKSTLKRLLSVSQIRATCLDM